MATSRAAYRTGGGSPPSARPRPCVHCRSRACEPSACNASPPASACPLRRWRAMRAPQRHAIAPPPPHASCAGGRPAWVGLLVAKTRNLGGGRPQAGGMIVATTTLLQKRWVYRSLPTAAGRRHERVNRTPAERLSVPRLVKKLDSNLVAGFVASCNCIGRHMGPGGIAPARATGIIIKGADPRSAPIRSAYRRAG